MKRLSLRLVAVVLGPGLLLAPTVAAGQLADLGLTEAKARDAIYNALCDGGLFFDGNARGVFLAAPPEVRVALVKAFATFGKAYVQSDEFRKRYEEYRDANRPKAPEAARPVDDQIAAQVKEMEEGLRQLQENVKSMPPDVQKEMQEAIESTKAQIAELKNNSELKETMAKGLQEDQAEAAAKFQEDLAGFDRRYPADVNQMVAGRLREFLDLTSDIDFDAKLVSSGSKMRFADANLEGKSSEWKLCFRAGKPAVDAARAFAQTWLKELQAGALTP